jgi:hypothetical protein
MEMNSHRLRWLAAGAALAACLVTGLGAAIVAPALAQEPAQHGISFLKGCASPTNIGSAYSCSYTVRNNSDEPQDTLTMNSLVDIVHAASGDVNSGNIIGSVQIKTTTAPGNNIPSGATCAAAAGDGVNVPYTGVTSCTLPFGSRVNVLSFSHYTVQAADFALPGHALTDDAALGWHDLCDGLAFPNPNPPPPALPGGGNCNPNPPNVGSASQSIINALASSTDTTIHNAAHGAVTVVEAGAVVHDFVTVTGVGGQPAPSGNVNIDFFVNNTCTGAPATNSGPVGPLVPVGGPVATFDATGFTQGPLAAGLYGFRAHYPGGGVYLASDGPCEPLRVVDANIQITPATDTNPVNTDHVLTCHINVNDGTGQTNAPNGTICTVAIIAGPGTPATQNCTVAGGAGNCTVTITSATTGTSVIRASTNVSVAGLVLHRETGDAHPGDGPNAQKLWVNANIQITPATATNAVNTNHLLTITVNAIGGNIDAGPHTATASIVSGPGSFVGSPTCTYTGGGATASCTVTITSTATGATVVSATSNIPVNGQTIPRTTATNPGPGGSGNASKTWVDANIQITPATDNNPVGTNHVLTIRVNALGGTIDAGPHTATASIVSGPGSFVGSPTCTYTGGAATATCTVTITSTTAGTTVVSATSAIPVGGQTITRTTGTAVNTASGGSGNASKNWGDVDNVTHVRDAANVDVTGGTVPAGTVVHDEAVVTKTAGTPAAVPAPTGTVTFTLYASNNCQGTVVATDANKPLNASGVATSVNFTTPVAGGQFSYLAHYNGDANYPAKDAACEPFSVQTPPSGLITHTNVDCADVLNGNASNSIIDALNYPSSAGKIGQGINPGKFFFWATITTTVPNQVVTVTQSNNSSNGAALIGIHQDWQRLYTGDCSSFITGTQINNGTGARFTVPTPGTYIIGIKYDPKTLAGTKVPVPATITYTFTTSLGGNTGASVELRPA